MPPFQFRGNVPSKDRGKGPKKDNRSGKSRPKTEFTFRFPPTSERPLLRTKRDTTPELLTAADSKPAPKFAPLDAISDSEEAEMDLSEESDEEERPRKRRALGLDGNTSPKPAPAPPAPKWSNPDPYTVLPPPDETQHKKLDVVKLIRKARLADSTAKAQQQDAVVDNDDFISLGILDGAEEDEQIDPARNAPENAPRGPKGMEVRESAAAKRTRDDQPKGFSTKLGKPQRRFNPDASILHAWRAMANQDASPWMNSIVPSMHLSTKFHNEVIAFYNWVRPHRYEQIVRSDLVNRLETGFKKRYGNIEIHPFGSFASGLYLPTADIDLVLMSPSFLRQGIKVFGERKGQIYAFSAFLKDLNIAIPGSIETIAHARVPILKFVDKLTGLRVDLSFDNDSGLLANRTFQTWKEQFPVIPVIVSVIKQFLLLRGLNEVPTGGLGGFSITCLVTSLLQHMPRHGQQNAGKVLLDFFNYYGNEFSYETTGIRMNPPGYFNKYGNRDRLMIEDPNNPSNDISGGTKEISLIFRSFSDAHLMLTNRLNSLAASRASDISLLGAIIAANYDEYTEQRYQLRRVFETAPQFGRYRVPPPPPPAPADPSPPPPPPTHAPRPTRH
ncbi:topoisomerase family protein TRF4 [Penicillium hispanicum]|uniref:topoisomerase family protein TRF4 n=1 Tax=Penicillium hispanicum TaxID=1080232 RepID=UPI002540DCCE|nr:topoisomerase family protein TRF4 [Penicillium hispanicum]KAJ5577886.1 topoisomerase family protein TRF4 [Penicillium hispanicum]